MTYFGIYPYVHYNEYLANTTVHNHNNYTIRFIMISVSSGPPQSQRRWLITQWVIAITNSTLLCWLRSACCSCLFYVQVQVRFTAAAGIEKYPVYTFVTGSSEYGCVIGRFFYQGNSEHRRKVVPTGEISH